MHLLSRIFALLYGMRRHSLLGLALRNWLILLFIALFVVGFELRWPSLLTLGWLALALAVIIAYALASRVGYKRFVTAPDVSLDEEFAAPGPEHRVPLRATGVFSVREYEDYVVERPAEYWRVPLGHHVVMVHQDHGGYLYQIVEPENIRDVQPGYLIFGREPQKALALHFQVSWGPEYAREPRFYEYGEVDADAQPVQERTIYFTFDHDADRHAVWRSLLEGDSP